MKRKYSYSSVFLIELITFALMFALRFAFGEKADQSVVYSILSAVFGWIFSFIIASGLINNRSGSLGEYFNQIQRINLKVIVVNLIIAVITFLVLVISGGFTTALLFLGFGGPNDNMSKGALTGVIIGFIFIVIFALFTTYSNHVLADPRNKDKSIDQAFKEVFVVGKKLFGKTLVLYLLYIILPVAILAAILFATSARKVSIELMVGTGLIGGGLILIYLLIAVPIISARIADNYLNLTGDIENSYEKKEENDDEYTITRNV